MDNLCRKEFLTGPFDECIHCPYLGSGCSGPRTTTMVHERYLVWMKALKKMRGYINQQIADGARVSKATVDDFFAGRRKDIGRTTAGLMEDFLIYGHIVTDSKWPCARTLDADKNIIYEDRPETVAALREQSDIIDDLRADNLAMRNNVSAEMERVRGEFEEDIKFYREQVLFAQQQLAFAQSQIAKKDEYIHVLMETAKKGGDLKSLELKLSEDK